MKFELTVLNISVLLGLLVLVGIGCSSDSQTSSPEQLIRIPYTSSTDNTERDYFLYLPRGYEQDSEKEWPVLMFLHGNGERGNGKDELDFVLIHGPLYEAWVQKRDLPFIIISPQLHMFGLDTTGISYLANRDPNIIPRRQEKGAPKRQSASSPKNSMDGAVPADPFDKDPLLPLGWEQCEQDLLGMLDHVKANYQVDENRVYLSGLSYGGFGTWYMASKHPELFAAINPIVGWGHQSLMEPIAKANLPVWAFAGGRDGVVEVRYFFEGVNKLEELGHTNLRFTIHEDMGHDTWKRVYAGDDIYNWLLSHSRD